jgi:hypothetical protein
MLASLTPSSVQAKSRDTKPSGPRPTEGDAPEGFLPPSDERLSVLVGFPKGTVTFPGKTRPIEIAVRNTGFEKATNVGVYVETPMGTSVTTDDSSWQCSAETTDDGFQCDYSKDLDSESATNVLMNIRSTGGTEPVSGSVTVTPFTDSEKEIIDRTSPFTIVDMGDAILIPQVQHLEKGKWEDWIDGTEVVAHVNDDFTYRVTVINEGHENLAADTVISIIEDAGEGVVFKDVTVVDGEGTCEVTTKSFSCESSSKTEIQEGEHLVTLAVTVEPTKVDSRLDLGDVVVTNTETSGEHRTGVHVDSITAPKLVEIEAHHRIQADAGGIAHVEVQLNNAKKGILHKSMKMTASLPEDFTFQKVTGKNWKCAQKKSRLSCSYSSVLRPGKSSSIADLFFEVDEDAVPSTDGHEIDFMSDHSELRLTMPILPAVKIHAVATPNAVTTNSNTDRNMVRLDADGSIGNGHALTYRWIQRCTTAKDVAIFKKCAKTGPTPKAEIMEETHARAHALLPHVSKATAFVFEVLISTQSTTEFRTVTVNASTSSVSASSVQATDTSVPFEIQKMLDTAQVTLTEVNSANGLLTAKATLPAAMMARFNVPTDAAIAFSANTSDPNECMVVHVGETTGSKDVVNIKITNTTAKSFEYIISSGKCVYGGQSYEGLSVNIHADVFGNTLNFTGPVTLVPNFKVVATARTNVLNVGALKDSFRFKNTFLTLTLDDLYGSTRLAIGAAIAIFGVDLDLSGSISAPVTVGGAYLDGVQADLTMALPQTFTFGEVKMKDLSLSVGVRYTPGLNNGSLTGVAEVKQALKDSGYVSINGTGTIEFMGTSIRITQLEVDYLDSVVAAVIFRMNANLNIPGMKKAEGSIAVTWYAPLPTQETGMAVDASLIIETNSGFSIGTTANPAVLHYRMQCIAISGQVIIPGILDATVSGYIVTGFPCMPAALKFDVVMGGFKAIGAGNKQARSILQDLPLPLAPGDWRFDVSNIKLTIGDFRMTGNFSIGEMYKVPYGSIDGTLHLSASDTKNTVYVSGSINPLTGIQLKGEAELEVAGIVSQFTIDTLVTANHQKISASAKVKIGTASVDLAGEFGMIAYRGEKVPTSSFSGTVNSFSMDGFNLGKASFSMSQTPTSVSVSAAMDIELGFINVEGKASFHTLSGGRGVVISLDANGELKVSDKWKGNMSFHLTNCGNPMCTNAGALRISAGGSAVLAGKNFDLGTFNFDTGGHFDERVSYSGRSCDRSDNIGGVQFEGCFGYSLEARLTDRSPYVSLDAGASLSVDSRTRCTTCSPRRWRGWSHWGTLRSNISIEFDPFKLHLRVGSIKVSFNGS